MNVLAIALPATLHELRVDVYAKASWYLLSELLAKPCDQVATFFWQLQYMYSIYKCVHVCIQFFTCTRRCCWTSTRRHGWMHCSWGTTRRSVPLMNRLSRCSCLLTIVHVCTVHVHVICHWGRAPMWKGETKCERPVCVAVRKNVVCRPFASKDLANLCSLHEAERQDSLLDGQKMLQNNQLHVHVHVHVVAIVLQVKKLLVWKLIVINCNQFSMVLIIGSAFFAEIAKHF